MRWPWQRAPEPPPAPSKPKYVMTRRRAEAIEWIADLLEEVGELELESALLSLVRKEEDARADLDAFNQRMLDLERISRAAAENERGSESLEASEETPTPSLDSEQQRQEYEELVERAAEAKVEAPEVVAADTDARPDAHLGEVTEAMIAKRAELAARRSGRAAPAAEEPAEQRRGVQTAAFARPPVVTLEQLRREG